jgi:hypothetical protein
MTSDTLVDGLPHSDGEKIRIEKVQYANGAIALRGWTEIGEPFATFSVNVVASCEKLKKNQTFMKTWSENEGMLEALQKAGIVGPTLFKVPCGHVEASAVEVLI